MSDVKMIGGEMPDWSDRRADERPPVRGAVLAEILRRIAPEGGRILVAGPHDDELIDALGSRTEVVCLLRSEIDALRLAERGLTVLCGTLAKVTDTDWTGPQRKTAVNPGYDLVIALDGLDRLCSVEGPQLNWAESVQVLRRALRPGGSLLLSVENELGVHRLVDRSAPTSAHGLGDWRPVGEFDETRPGSPTRLEAKLSADGLAVSWLAAGWPVPSAPALLATPHALRDGPGAALSAAAAGAAGTAYAGVPVLSDPRRLAAAAVRGGLGAEFAASWIVLAHRGPRSAPAFAPPPVLLGGDGPVVELIHDEDGGWVRKVVSGTATPGRDAARLNGPLPTGRLVEELLLAACLRHDLRAARRLLSGWAAWAGTLEAESRASATADNVLLDGDCYALLDPSRIGPDASPVQALRRFAETLLGGGYAHPWASATDVDTLTTVLAGAAGLEHVPATEPTRGGKPKVNPPNEPTRGGKPKANPPDEPTRGGAQNATPGMNSLREQDEELRLLRERLADAATRAAWFEAELAGRDSELRRARMQIKAFSGKFSYRVAKLSAVSARKARNALRRVGKDR